MANDFFLRQNVLLKVCLVAWAVAITLLCRAGIVGLLILFNLIAFLPARELNASFLRTVVKLSFFWIFYLLSGLVFNITFDSQVGFMLRVLLMLQLSVFLQKSISFESMLQETKPLLKYRLYQNIVYFMMYFGSIFKYITERYKNDMPKKLSKKYFERLLLVIKSVLDSTESIKESLPQIDAENIRRAPFTWSNLYLLCMVAFYTIGFAL